MYMYKFVIVPSSSPVEVVAEADENQLFIFVNWSEVEESERNGRILGYLV